MSLNYGFSHLLMPSKNYKFFTIIAYYADKSFIRNTFSHSTYKALSDDVVGAGKNLCINNKYGLGSDDVETEAKDEAYLETD